ncbi:thermonuclease family protein [Roseospira goensis]|uniref:Endonuclease YncB(Thermonuclease family) n=1 Tax=Roseospira goensis TaxID=391922 RepID=A0A7W6WIV0_9PROT|nr:thermonuclease family protein [Roseospira goensis]MBB4284325.1 endonuclease YncB(thermonuclease family) [Roseospira goensis]
MTLAVAAAMEAGPAAAAETAGPAPRPIVIDGDTVQTETGLFTLSGIDAPELGQRCQQAGRWIACGQNAAFALHRSLGLSLVPLVCTPAGAPDPETGVDRATCALGGQKDIALVLLSQGLALALADAPLRYREAEAGARTGGLGLWRTDFVRPADWRRGARLPDDPVIDPPPCPIKATVDADGRRVFLVPLDAGYADLPDGAVEARYCSDEAALADGWGRPSLDAASPRP